MDSNKPTSDHIQSISHIMCGFFRTFGLWKPYEKSETSVNLYSVYSVILLFTFPITYAFFMVCNIFFLTDSAELTNRLYVSFTQAALAIKVINFFFNNREWQQILTEIGEFRLKSSKEVKSIQQRALVIQVLYFIYMIDCNITIFGYAIFPLLNGAKDLIYSAWYPGLDWQNNRKTYWIVYTYQEIGSLITVHLNVTIDSYYCFLMYILSAQVNIFGDRLSELQAADGANTVHQNYLNLIETIQMHRRLNKTVALIQNNLQWAYFCQVLLSGIVICSVVNEFATVIIVL